MARTSLFLVAILATGPSVGLADPLDDQLASRLLLWRSHAYNCKAPSGFEFPSGEPGSGPPGCEDGDMVLFAGLLCSVGESYACETVRRSQKLDAGDDFGRWYRSPRRMETGNDADQDGRTNENEPEGTDLDGDGRANEGEWHTFSYDMALGVMLYLVATSDKESGQRWWDWLHSYTPCITGNKPECLTFVGGFAGVPRYPFAGDPRFCAPPSSVKEWEIGKKQACTLRPPRFAAAIAESAGLGPFLGSDYAILAEVGRHLGLQASPGRFADELAAIGDTAPQKFLASARANDEGYSEHISAVSNYLMQRMGRNDPDLAMAAAILNCKKPPLLERLVLDPAKCTPKDPENAFFLYLRDGPTSEAKQSVLDRCPAPGRLPVWRGDWIFQRHGPDLTWKHSMYWDCIFMARLLGIR